MGEQWDIEKRRQLYIWAFQAVALTALFAFVWFIAHEKKYKEVDVPQLVASMSTITQDEWHEEDILSLKRRFGLAANDFAAVGYFGPNSNMDAAELLLVRVNEKSQIDAVVEAMKNRVAYQCTCFDGYGEDQMALLKDARYLTRGYYVFLIISSDASSVEREFLKQIEP
ncbi:MAG: DUF4358 domain-containing protein [Lachnospiraceae bacterium]|nr:DUF4358 domain-containing protein [Lachnospiraceae bacterium]